jgi:hypothetical protein
MGLYFVQKILTTNFIVIGTHALRTDKSGQSNKISDTNPHAAGDKENECAGCRRCAKFLFFFHQSSLTSTLAIATDK